MDKFRINDQNSQVFVKNNHSSTFLFPVSEEEVVDVVSKLEGKTSAAFDEISEFLIKECIQNIKKPLSFIFNESINKGSFPNLMKIAEVRPVYRKGDRRDISNYRPISVLPIFSKSLEKIMYNRLLSLVEKYNILAEGLNGFRGNKSTETVCQAFIENVQQALMVGYLFWVYFLILPRHTM
jgi:hypothetical protein